MIYFVTTFNLTNYNDYAKSMLDSVVENWKEDELKLIVYLEGFSNSKDLDLLPVTPLIEYRDLSLLTDLNTFKEKFKQLDGTDGGSHPYTFTRDAVRFSHKVYALADFYLGLKPSYNGGPVIWLDADTLTIKPINEERLMNILSDKVAISHLGRSKIAYSESGFISFNTSYESTFNFMKDFKNIYDTGEILSFAQLTDAFIFTRLLNRYKAMGMPIQNLTEGVEEIGPNNSMLDVISQCPLGEYFVHNKGKRKIPGALGLSPDINIPRYKQLLDVVSLYGDKKIVEVGTWNGGVAIQMASILFNKLKEVHYIGFGLFEDSTENSIKGINSLESVTKRLEAFAKDALEKERTFTFELIKGDTRVTLPANKDKLTDASFAFIDGERNEDILKSNFESLTHVPVVVFDGYISPDENGKTVSNELLGTNRLFDSIEYKRKKVLPSQDRVNGGGVVHLALVINSDTVQDIPSSMTRVPIIVRPKDCMPQDYIINNINENLNLIKKWGFVKPCRPQTRPVILVSAGPSLDFDELRRTIKETDGVVVTVKHSYPLLLRERIKQWACVILDPRPIEGVSTHGIVRKELFQKVDKKTKFFLASMTDTSVTKYLMERTPNVYGWHAYSDAIKGEGEVKGKQVKIAKGLNIPDDTVFVTGGTCAAMRAFGLMHILGFRTFHLFGFDGCYLGEITKEQRAMVAEDGRPKFIKVETNNKPYWTTGELLAMAQDCERLFNNKEVDSNIIFHGKDTLVSEVWQTSWQKSIPNYTDYFNE